MVVLRRGRTVQLYTLCGGGTLQRARMYWCPGCVSLRPYDNAAERVLRCGGQSDRAARVRLQLQGSGADEQP